MDDPLAQTVQRFVIVPVAALTSSEHKIGASNSHSACLSQARKRCSKKSKGLHGESVGFKIWDLTITQYVDDINLLPNDVSAMVVLGWCS